MPVILQNLLIRELFTCKAVQEHMFRGAVISLHFGVMVTGIFSGLAVGAFLPVPE